MKYNQRGGAETYYRWPGRRPEPSLPLLHPALRGKAKETRGLQINQFPLLASFLSCLLLLYILWIKLIIFMQRSNSILLPFESRRQILWGSHTLEKDGKLYTRLWLFPVAQPSLLF